MNITLAHPLPGSTPTDGFGWRDAIPSIGLPAQLHNGQDYAAPLGTKILAAHDGTVTGVFYDHEQGGGWMVRIAAPFGYTMYGHMRAQSPYVKYGDKVSAGDVIGEVGATGIATGAHLHFILVIDGEPVNPVPYIGNTVPTIPADAWEIGEEMFIAVVNGNWYLVVPQGNAKPRAVVLGADSGAATSGLPIVRYTWAKSIEQLKNAVAGL